LRKRGPREGDKLGSTGNELPGGFEKRFIIRTRGGRGSGDVMTTTITDFRSRGGTNEIPNFPKKTLFGGKFVGLSRVDILRKAKKKESTQKK
jgi:hypothetical protein